MSEATFHTTMQDLRRAESKLSLCHSGKTPADSHVSRMKSIIDKNTDIGAQIEKVKANLPLPDQPPVASDWNSLDQRITGVGSGRLEFPPDNTGLHGSLAPGKSADELELEI